MHKLLNINALYAELEFFLLLNNKGILKFVKKKKRINYLFAVAVVVVIDY